MIAKILSLFSTIVFGIKLLAILEVTIVKARIKESYSNSYNTMCTTVWSRVLIWCRNLRETQTRVYARHG